MIKLKLISFFIARYLTDSLRGPVLTLQNEALCAEFPDGMGWGWTGYQKCPSIFFILCGYTDHVYMYLYIYTQKLSPTFLWVSKFDVKLEGGGIIFKITICRCVFFF